MWINFNSPPLSAAYMHHWTVAALVQVMACRLFGTKSLPDPMLAHRQLNHKEKNSVKFEAKYKNFIHENIFEISSVKRHFGQGGMR